MSKKKSKIGLVYCITNILNDMQYIGFTNGDPKTRLRNHTKGGNGAASLLYEAIKEFGVENFTLHTVFEGTYKQALKKEKYYIKKFNTITPNGYNKSSGGEAMLLPEARAKVSAANTGRKHTSATKIKISQSHIGMKYSAETRAKVGAAEIGNTYRVGKIHTPETKAKISVKLTGRKASPATRAKLSEARKGNKNAEGMQHTSESREKISKGLLAFYKKKRNDSR